MSGPASVPLVSFTLEGARYAFPVGDVVEVTSAVPITPISTIALPFTLSVPPDARSSAPSKSIALARIDP